jgi:hypothetical protein
VLPHLRSGEGAPPDRDTSLQIVADMLLKMTTAADDELRPLLDSLPEDLHADCEYVVCNVYHFVDDADIRRYDYEYSDVQRRVLVGLIEALQRRAPLAELQNYHFLGPVADR